MLRLTEPLDGGHPGRADAQGAIDALAWTLLRAATGSRTVANDWYADLTDDLTARALRGSLAISRAELLWTATRGTCTRSPSGSLGRPRLRVGPRADKKDSNPDPPAPSLGKRRERRLPDGLTLGTYVALEVVCTLLLIAVVLVVL
jgi:hypothetical protein